ncbi:uncharacterized protein si:ch1073-456m8.1 [Xyrauchen texanus]|uniref:uncharacterized protein si:ch1073-456m8.1 n=1 Tax=Xyrauchen texanus TaxID=154827 RepID=UPI002241BDE5|nr:uncharacterized protein si:ch1073-456m8.1 [Xyrauchen texanus]
MHSGSLERAASLRKRALSRGMSEDESLRLIAREINLRVSYEDCFQEVRALELQQEALMFQVDCLQDALEGSEEMLAEAQRETHNVTLELEREREARRKLESMVTSLMLERDKLQEERNSVPIIALNNLMGDPTHGVQNCLQDTDNSTVISGTSVDEVLSKEGMITVHLISKCPASTEEPVLSFSKAALGSLFKSGKTGQTIHAGPIWLQGAPEGTSVDQEAKSLSDTQAFSQSVHFNKKREAQDGYDNDESNGYEDAPSEFSPSLTTPDVLPDGGLLEVEIYGDDVKNTSESRIPKSAESCALS